MLMHQTVIKVLGKGIKKESFQFAYYRAVFFVFKRDRRSKMIGF
jgi:hypothetical protein